MGKIASERYGGRGSNNEVAHLVKEDPEIHKQVEQAFVERLIYGDFANHSGNFVVAPEAGHVMVRNIDLEHGFPSHKTPEWNRVAGPGENQRLRADLSGQPLSKETRDKIDRFVKLYSKEEGRADLAKAGLKPDEIDGLLSRARWLATEGRFPEAKTGP